MNGYASGNEYGNGFAADSGDNFTRRVEEWIAGAAQHLDKEMIDAVNQAASHIETVVVPELRRESAQALRLMAMHLDRLADRLHPEGARPQ